MTRVVALPRLPRPVPPLDVDPRAIGNFATDLLAASARVDDLGTFAAGDARVGDWRGAASAAYHDAIRPTGRRADAVSLVVRDVARLAAHHAETMQRLLERRSALDSERAHLVATIAALRTRAMGRPAEAAAALQEVCDDTARGVRAFEADLDTWATDLVAEEEAMREAFTRATSLDRVDRRDGDSEDRADQALASPPRPGATAREVNAWWDGLDRADQLALIAASPGSIGNRDGIPPWARDAANTVALGRDLATWGSLEAQGLLAGDEQAWLENARAAQGARDTIERGLDPVTGERVPSQLYLYDPAAFDGDGAVAVCAGDLATADNVSVLVPGFGTDGGSAAYQAERALTLHEAGRSLDGDQTNASMIWIGYDAPDNGPWHEDWDGAGVVTEEMATRGGDRLADALDGLRASRDGDPAHLTVIGHSYGTTTLGHAAHDHGVPVDEIVLVGSPGVGGDTDHAADLGIDPGHVWAGANSRDPIASMGNHGWLHLGSALGGGGLGNDPAEDDFGATRFRAESTTRADGIGGMGDHAKYFLHDTESLYDISQVVNGNYEAVMGAVHVTDPWYAAPRDPEWDRRPTAPDTDRLGA